EGGSDRPRDAHASHRRRLRAGLLRDHVRRSVLHGRGPQPDVLGDALSARSRDDVRRRGRVPRKRGLVPLRSRPQVRRRRDLHVVTQTTQDFMTMIDSCPTVSGASHMMPGSPFAVLGLALPLVRALVDEGYDYPTPVQRRAIPAVLDGSDLLACAQTGT